MCVCILCSGAGTGNALSLRSASREDDVAVRSSSRIVWTGLARDASVVQATLDPSRVANNPRRRPSHHRSAPRGNTLRFCHACSVAVYSWRPMRSSSASSLFVGTLRSLPQLAPRPTGCLRVERSAVSLIANRSRPSNPTCVLTQSWRTLLPEES